MKAPLVQYVHSKKAIAARNAILMGERPVRVAEEYGFSDYSTFYRTYTKFIGTAPTGKTSFKEDQRD